MEREKYGVKGTDMAGTTVSIAPEILNWVLEKVQLGNVNHSVLDLLNKWKTGEKVLPGRDPGIHPGREDGPVPGTGNSHRDCRGRLFLYRDRRGGSGRSAL